MPRKPGFKASEATKLKQSKTLKAYWKNRPRWNEGKKTPLSVRLKMSAAHKGKNSGKKNGMWRGGRRVSPRGYIYVHQKFHPRANKRDGYIFEHILVVEKYLGRFMRPGEVVHHRNKERGDNSIHNLMVFKSNASHLSYEAGNPIKVGDVILNGRFYGHKRSH